MKGGKSLTKRTSQEKCSVIALITGELLAVKYKDSPNTYPESGDLVIFVTESNYSLVKAYHIPFSLLI